MALLNYTGKNILGVIMETGDIIRLYPQINEIDDIILSKMKENPLFKAAIQSGKIQIMLENLTKDGKRTIEDMLNNIPKILDVKLLKKIIETDGRDRVVKAANDQLDTIKNPSKPKESTDEHFQ